MSVLIYVVLVTASLICWAAATPLDDYVKAPDDHYNWTVLTQKRRDSYTLHVLNMTSQKWMDDNYSNHPIWWHYVIVIVPHKVKVTDTALLLIGGGGAKKKVPDEKDIWVSAYALIAVSTQTVTAIVQQVPNQPIVFMSDPLRRKRSEDSLLSWAWKQYMEQPAQPNRLAHMAMTKAVVRAMDTVTAYNQRIRHQQIDKYFIAGASKRGWATWLTSAVDSRIIGMAPVVFDLLDMNKALHHHYQSLGGWTFAFKDYFEANITRDLGNSAFNKSTDIIDPLAYKDRYKMPTYIIKAAGDEFFLLDETVTFYDLLPQPKYLRVLPNCEHTMINQISNVLLGLRSFYESLLHGSAYPKVDWTMTSSNYSGKIHVTMDRTPLTVIVYQANTLNNERRDFRLLSRNPKTGKVTYNPVIWFKGQARQLTPTEYEVIVKKPSYGWTGFFIEMTFQGVQDSVLAFSTEVNIVPNTLPFPDCTSNCTDLPKTTIQENNGCLGEVVVLKSDAIEEIIKSIHLEDTQFRHMNVIVVTCSRSHNSVGWGRADTFVATASHFSQATGGRWQHDVGFGKNVSRQPSGYEYKTRDSNQAIVPAVQAPAISFFISLVGWHPPLALE